MTDTPQGVSEYPLEKNPSAGVTSLRMNPWLRTVTPVLALTFAVVATAAKPKAEPERMTPVPADQPIPLEDFFRPPLFRDPTLNFRGTHCALLMSPRFGQTQLVAYELDTRKMERTGGGENSEVFQCHWLNDEKLVYGLVTKSSYSLHVANLGKFSQTEQMMRYNTLRIVGFPRSPEGHMVAWVRASMKELWSDGGVVRFNLADLNVFSELGSGFRAEAVATYQAPRDQDVVAYLPDNNGDLGFAVTFKDGGWHLHRYLDQKWVGTAVDLKKTPFLDIGDREGEILVLARKEAERPFSVYRMDAVSGVLGDLVHEDEKFSLAGAEVHRDPRSRKILGLSYHGTIKKTVWFDPLFKEVQLALNQSFPRDIVTVIGCDADRTKFFVEVTSDVRPPAYRVFNRATGEAVQHLNSAPWINPDRMRPMREVAYRARDGKLLSGYLTLPAGASKNAPAPMVVLISREHWKSEKWGKTPLVRTLPDTGPWARAEFGWDEEAQFFASRGYAVFQPNYRGSLGYDWNALDDMWDFQKMSRDVTDGVNAVVKTGFVNRDRVAIVGSYFGGYLAMAGVSNGEETYRCAVGRAGTYDWRRIVQEIRDKKYFIQLDTFTRYLGRLDDRAKYAAVSPLQNVDKIKVPVMIVHGEFDHRTAVYQAKLFVDELRKHNVPHESLIMSEEGHSFYELDNLVKYYSSVEIFLAKHMTPRPATGLTP